MNSTDSLSTSHIPPTPPLNLQGEFSIRELVAQWQKVPQEAPVVLFDLPKLRYEYQLAWEQKFAVPVETATVAQPIVLEIPELPTLLSAQATPAPLTARQLRVAQLHARQQAVLPTTNEIIALPGLVQEIETKPSWKFPSIAWPEISLPKLSINWFEVAGNFALSSAVALTLLFGGPIVILETQSFISKAMQSLNPAPQGMPVVQMPAEQTSTPEPIITTAEDVFSIKVPSLNISSTVVANVDATDENQYTAALKEGIAHAKGSALPDQLEDNKTIYLFAHSTDAPWNILRYNAQFYALKDAEVGAEITLRFWGEDRTYIIQETKIIEAHDVSYMEPQTDQEKLILQTCYPPGTADKRLVVIATPVEKSE